MTHAVILAGGLARRMGGGDKPLRDIAGRTMLDRVLDALRPQVAGLALNANGDPARFAPWGLPVLADPVEGYVGPLAGVLAGMDWAAAQGARWLVSASGDSPFLPADYVARLHAARQAAGASMKLAEAVMAPMTKAPPSESPVSQPASTPMTPCTSGASVP
jgi:molybdopterin-guanine dinucleotide biosynthesis protein A